MRCNNCQKETSKIRFCSMRCRVNFSTQKRSCDWCKKKFFMVKHRPNKYCSKECFFLECRAHTYEVKCYQCNKAIVIKKVRLVRSQKFFCGVKCREISKRIYTPQEKRCIKRARAFLIHMGIRSSKSADYKNLVNILTQYHLTKENVNV